MTTRRGSSALGAVFTLLASAGVGCSLIVSGDVPDFQCSGTSDTACPSGMTCSASGRCVVADGSVEPDEAGDETAPPDADMPEVKADADASTGPADLGQKCRVDADCKSRLCASSTVLTTVITSSTGPICTTPCCTSSECSAGFVCFNGGTGGGYCVSSALAQRTPPATGGKLGGSSCTKGTDCRSGLCGQSTGTCIDTCCVEANCFGGSTCLIASVAAPGPPHDTWVCAPPDPAATKLPGTVCADSTECKSENCIGVSSGRVCRPSCSGTASCKAVSGFSAGHCRYGTSGSDFFRFCSVSGVASGSDPAGTPCADLSTCQSDYCDAELKKCAEVCGHDADCAANEICRPSGVGTPYLRCVPKP